MSKNIVVFGASGAIGSAFVTELLKANDIYRLWAVSRSGTSYDNPHVKNIISDIINENRIADIASEIGQYGALDMVLVATGALHWKHYMPEKSLKELSQEHFLESYTINAVLPALIAKYFIPLLAHQHKAVFAALSARVGSISDNRLGGWYSYRAAKAALNMIIKNLAIEAARKNKNAVIAGLHPGTVKSHLSQPFQSHVPEYKLFTPEYAAQCLLEVVGNLTPDDSGKCFAYDGNEVEP